MTITLHSILLLLALIVFVLAALNVPPSSRVNLIATGLALVVLAMLVT